MREPTPYEVEVITTRIDFGEFTKFKGYKSAKRFAIKLSLESDVIECSLKYDGENEREYELHEYYVNGRLSIKII